MDATKALFMFELIGIPVSLCMLPFIAPENHALIWLIMGLGIGETFVLMLYFYALRVGQLAIVGTILEANVIITVALSVLILHESFYLLKVIAIIIIIIGVMMLGIPIKDVRKLRKMNVLAGVIPTLLASVGTGIYFFFVGISARINGWFTTALGIRIMIVLTIVIIFIVQKKEVFSLFKKVE